MLVAHTLSFFLYCLIKNPKAKSVLQSHLNAIVPTGPVGSSNDRLLTLADVAKCDSLSHCLKESQRSVFIKIKINCFLWMMQIVSSSPPYISMHPRGYQIQWDNNAAGVHCVGYVHLLMPAVYALSECLYVHWDVAVCLRSMFRQQWIERPEEFVPERWEETASQVSRRVYG